MIPLFRLMEVHHLGGRMRKHMREKDTCFSRPLHGFTLVELLVVIAIIGVLVALLLPAVQAAREAARRAQCQSHLRNVALAVLNYHETNKHYPVGFIPTGPTGAIESWSWSVFILPFLEEQSIYDQLRPSAAFLQPVEGTRKGPRNLADVFAAGASNPAEIVPLQTPLSIFRCPSDTTPDLVPCDGNCPASNYPQRQQDTGQWERSFLGVYAKQLSPTFFPSASNYVGSRGMIDAGCSGSGSSPNWVPNKARCDTHGIFYGDSHVSINQVTDGTSKTFMIGERDKFCLSATWIGVRNPLNGAEMHGSYWGMAHVGIPLNYPWTGAYNTCTEGFSSSHNGGAFFVYCDGSVHFINEDIEFELAFNTPDCWADRSNKLLGCQTRKFGRIIGVYQRLAWRDDGELIDDN